MPRKADQTPHVTVVMPSGTLKGLRDRAEAEKRSVSAQALLYIEKGLKDDGGS